MKKLKSLYEHVANQLLKKVLKQMLLQEFIKCMALFRQMFARDYYQVNSITIIVIW